MKIIISIFVLVAAIFLFLIGGCAWETRQIETERNKVKMIVKNEEQWLDVKPRLVSNGYRFTYDEPIDQTGQGEYLIQLIPIGDTSPNGLDTFFYVVTGGDNPFRPSSPYVAIRMTPEGKITGVD